MSDSKKKPDNYKVDADDVADEEFEIVDVNGEKGILTLDLAIEKLKLCKIDFCSFSWISIPPWVWVLLKSYSIIFCFFAVRDINY